MMKKGDICFNGFSSGDLRRLGIQPGLPELSARFFMGCESPGGGCDMMGASQWGVLNRCRTNALVGI